MFCINLDGEHFCSHVSFHRGSFSCLTFFTMYYRVFQSGGFSYWPWCNEFKKGRVGRDAHAHTHWRAVECGQACRVRPRAERWPRHRPVLIDTSVLAIKTWILKDSYGRGVGDIQSRSSSGVYLGHPQVLERHCVYSLVDTRSQLLDFDGCPGFRSFQYWWQIAARDCRPVVPLNRTVLRGGKKETMETSYT